MNRSGTRFLKIVLMLMAIVVLGVLLYFPQLEGRNANASQLQIYFHDPFLIYIYLTSIPFFATLYQSFKLLGLIEINKAFSQTAVNVLRSIKYCALYLSGGISLAIPYIMGLAQNDDSPGLVLLIAIVVFTSIVIATAAAVFQKLLQNAVDIKSENDLTV